jgi:hypothetical protein
VKFLSPIVTAGLPVPGSGAVVVVEVVLDVPLVGGGEPDAAPPHPAMSSAAKTPAIGATAAARFSGTRTGERAPS